MENAPAQSDSPSTAGKSIVSLAAWHPGIRCRRGPSQVALITLIRHVRGRLRSSSANIRRIQRGGGCTPTSRWSLVQRSRTWVPGWRLELALGQVCFCKSNLLHRWLYKSVLALRSCAHLQYIHTYYIHTVLDIPSTPHHPPQPCSPHQTAKIPGPGRS